MKSNQIRQAFLDFFHERGHQIVPSAPMVLKDDPTLMFTNAGMNQFKEYFLGNKVPPHPRVADSQKCLRVSGKHNDLEEVGHDTYHHTMFEMLGNWSFGDYFKAGAIAWAWEFLTGRLGLSQERLYATIFEGDQEVSKDTEAQGHWQRYLPAEQILEGNKKDNFWEMGDTGPCGPCSEIHIDLRPDQERAQTDGAALVNHDHPQVVEIWNLVFIQYNRKADGSLEQLPDQHVDTGMGFERLAMAMQDKRSNYDTDVFQPVIRKVEELTGLDYGKDKETDIAMRVVSDHLRTVSFSIAEGQLPSNARAGYVIRRILRRAVRYAYTFLHQTDAFMFKLVETLSGQMGGAYPELKAQQHIIEKVIQEEEQSFLKTLETGIKMLDRLISQTLETGAKEIDGRVAFALYDSYGFPPDLTRLILKEHGLGFSEQSYQQAMEEQKKRSRSAASVETEDWTEVANGGPTRFIGYEHTEADVRIRKYRKIKKGKKTLYQLVLDQTPFYAESGGQIGDKGYLENGQEKLYIIDTQKELDTIMHLTQHVPENPGQPFRAVVKESERRDTERNHSATHLLHEALRNVLGTHVEQKGSLVAPDYLRFDFSHFQKLSDEELAQIEGFVNEKIRQDIPLQEKREVPMTAALDMGAMALFGEKYSDHVRVVRFGDSVELCGGTHVSATGKIGILKVTSESAISAGIRRIEAVTGKEAEAFFRKQDQQLKAIAALLKSPADLVKTVAQLTEANAAQRKKIEQYERERALAQKESLKNNARKAGHIHIVSGLVDVPQAGALKEIAFQLKNELEPVFLAIGAAIDGKAHLAVMISEELVKEKELNAGQIVREAAKYIRGGGGGQPFFATAGGKNPDGLEEAIAHALKTLEE